MDDEQKAAASRRLAELLGWRVTCEMDSEDEEAYRLYGPMGEPVNFWVGGRFPVYLTWDEADAWAHAPDYYTSTDATLAELPDNREVRLRYRDPHRKVFLAQIEDWDEWNNTVWYEGEGATRAEALAAALLAYAKAGALKRAGGEAQS